MGGRDFLTGSDMALTRGISSFLDHFLNYLHLFFSRDLANRARLHNSVA